MNKASIFLAGWLTTAVVALAVIVGMANGGFGASAATQSGQMSGDTRTSLAAGDAALAQSAVLDGSGAGQPQGDVLYVYPDGSPAPDPALTDGAQTARYHDDEDDEDAYEDEHDDDEHEDEDDD